MRSYIAIICLFAACSEHTESDALPQLQPSAEVPISELAITPVQEMRETFDRRR